MNGAFLCFFKKNGDIVQPLLFSVYTVTVTVNDCSRTKKDSRRGYLSSDINSTAMQRLLNQ
jgi:hypothetical protein